MDNDDIPELTETEKARLQALSSAYRALGEAAAAGDATDDDVVATLAQARRIELDPARPGSSTRSTSPTTLASTRERSSDC